MVTKPRRGVLLLVVLALLAMFAMVAVAFVVLTSAEKRTALRVLANGARDDSPQKDLNQGYDVLVRGGPNTWWSLLETMYGDATIGTPNAPATIGATTPVLNGQLIEFALPGGTDPFHWVGCVLTMLDGPAAGLSTHIVGIDPQNYNVQIVAFDGGVPPQPGNHYMVNGFPYSGMGFGYNPATGTLGPSALRPTSLRPLSARCRAASTPTIRLPTTRTPLGTCRSEPEYGRDLRADPVAAPVRSDRHTNATQCRAIAAGDVPAQLDRSPEFYGQQSDRDVHSGNAQFQSGVGRDLRSTEPIFLGRRQ